MNMSSFKYIWKSTEIIILIIYQKSQDQIQINVYEFRYTWIPSHIVISHLNLYTQEFLISNVKSCVYEFIYMLYNMHSWFRVVPHISYMNSCDLWNSMNSYMNSGIPRFQTQPGGDLDDYQHTSDTDWQQPLSDTQPRDSNTLCWNLKTSQLKMPTGFSKGQSIISRVSEPMPPLSACWAAGAGAKQSSVNSVSPSISYHVGCLFKVSKSQPFEWLFKKKWLFGCLWYRPRIRDHSRWTSFLRQNSSWACSSATFSLPCINP